MNEKLRKLQATFASLSNDLKPLIEKNSGDGLTDEEGHRFDELVEQLNKCGEDIAAEQNRLAASQKAAAQIKDADTPAGRELVTEPKGAGAKSLGQRFAESPAVTEYRGKGRSQAFEAGSFWHRDAPMAHHAEMGPQELRDLIHTGGITTNYLAPQRVPGFFRGDDLQGTLRDVLINGTTTADAIMFFREDTFTNSATGVAQAAFTDPNADSGDEVKPESAITFEEDVAPVVTIAHWIPITRQTIQDAPQLQTYVEQRLIDGLRLAESDQLLNGGGAPDLDGLLGTTGVQALDGTYFTSNAVLDAGSPNENYNRILRGRTLVRTVGRARATFAVVNPEDMEFFLSASNGSQDYYGAGPFGSAELLARMWGLRIVEDENLTAGQVLVGDGRMAAVWDRMQAQILIDTINDQFIRNMLTLLAEERLALTVFRPAAFALVDLAAWV